MRVSIYIPAFWASGELRSRIWAAACEHTALPPLPGHSLVQFFHLLKLHTFLSSLNTLLSLQHKIWGQPLVWHRGETCQREKHRSSDLWTKQLHSFDVSSLSFSLINCMAALCTEPKKCSCIGAILVLFWASHLATCPVQTSVLQPVVCRDNMDYVLIWDVGIGTIWDTMDYFLW